jgi:hypothetical protein
MFAAFVLVRLNADVRSVGEFGNCTDYVPLVVDFDMMARQSYVRAEAVVDPLRHFCGIE